MANMELLAPAGGMEQLRYALHFGADAVYMGGDEFGLRRQADAFSEEEFARGVAWAHERGAHVHVPVNILMHDADIDRLGTYLNHLETLGVDALIVSDLGALRLARRFAPNTDVHISTQASCANAEAAFAYHDLGATRIVLARELSLSEIAQIRARIPDELELEAFVHGSMCMAVSGRCLMSDYLNGRSANQGRCSQPCRWEYAVVEQKRPGRYFPVEEDAHGTYLFSSADLMMLDHLADLEQAGIDAIKIEGRAKSFHYVATVVNAYRQVLDGAPAATLLPELEAVSHRPYHTGFFYGPALQTGETEGYQQTHDLIATVASCQPRDDGCFDITVVERNRFFAGDELEALSPAHPIRRLTVSGLVHEEDGPVSTANKTMERYRFVSALSLEADDILRRRRPVAPSSFVSLDEGAPSMKG
jgi:U32 family peptidase